MALDKEASLFYDAPVPPLPQARAAPLIAIEPIDEAPRQQKTLRRAPASSLLMALEQLEEVAKNNEQTPNTFVANGKVSSLDDSTFIAQSAVEERKSSEPETILINFNNVSIVEYIRFISRVSNKNFIFDEANLQFSVTIVSEEPTTLDNVMMALMQELRIHNLDMIEEGSTILIYQAPDIRAPGTVVSDSIPASTGQKSDIVTRVFSLNTSSPNSVSGIISQVLSDSAIVSILPDNNHIIVTDIASNITKVHDLIKSVDAPNSSMIIGQYVVRNAFIDILISSAEVIMQSIAPGQQITFVAHAPSNSIFIIANPFLVERAIPILQRLDQTDGTTGIFDLDQLKYQPQFLRDRTEEEPVSDDESFGVIEEEEEVPVEEVTPEGDRIIRKSRNLGSWKLDKSGAWFYDLPTIQSNLVRDQPPKGSWREDSEGNWQFAEGLQPRSGDEEVRPRGHWQRETSGQWRYILAPDESIFAGKRIRPIRATEALPLGHIEKTKFYLHKLQYRNGEGIQQAIKRIGDSIARNEGISSELVATIDSVQWLEESNSLVFTGTPDSLLKVKELVEEIDTPLRQVFLEMLILQTTVDDALNYGVNLGSKFGGGNTAGAQAFISGASALDSLLSSSGTTQGSDGIAETLIPSASSATTGTTGYNLGIIGQNISCNGLSFQSIAGVLRAVHDRVDVDVILNPKIITEDNVPAEIFVGINTSFKTQSIANDEGSILTNNFEFRDVGTTLKVTPLLGPTNMVTLDIDFEDSSVVPSQQEGDELSNQITGPTTRITKTKNRFHVPDSYFLVISGMIRRETLRTRSHVPCLGATPLIGAAFSSKNLIDEKRNLMIFIRPQLIDTESEINALTKRQQDIYRIKRRSQKMWQLDSEEALDWLNLKTVSPLNEENGCCSDEDY